MLPLPPHRSHTQEVLQPADLICNHLSLQRKEYNFSFYISYFPIMPVEVGGNSEHSNSEMKFTWTAWEFIQKTFPVILLLWQSSNPVVQPAVEFSVLPFLFLITILNMLDSLTVLGRKTFSISHDVRISINMLMSWWTGQHAHWQQAAMHCVLWHLSIITSTEFHHFKWNICLLYLLLCRATSGCIFLSAASFYLLKQ